MRLLTAVSLVRVQQGEVIDRKHILAVYKNIRGNFNIWLRGQAVKTSPFHGGNTGSIPVGVTEKSEKDFSTIS